MVLKNLQVLPKNIKLDELMSTMDGFTFGLASIANSVMRRLGWPLGKSLPPGRTRLTIRLTIRPPSAQPGK